MAEPITVKMSFQPCSPAYAAIAALRILGPLFNETEREKTIHEYADDGRECVYSRAVSIWLLNAERYVIYSHWIPLSTALENATVTIPLDIEEAVCLVP